MPEQFTPQMELFCREYIANRFIGAKAARAAGYNGDVYTLSVQANRLLKKDKVKAQIKKLRDEYFADKEKLGRDVVTELYKLGMRRMSDVVRKTEDGKIHLKEFEEMGGSEVAINKLEIKETDITNGDNESIGTTTETKVWLEGKTKPLELLAKYSNVIVDKQEIDHNIKKVEEVKITVVDPKKEGKDNEE